MSIEIIKHGTEEAIKKYDKVNDKRQSYICNRCGCSWKCDYNDNNFGTAHDYNGDPDILCPECHCPDTKEVDGIMDIESDDEPSDSCRDCAYFNGWVVPNRCDAHSSFNSLAKKEGICKHFRRRNYL